MTSSTTTNPVLDSSAEVLYATNAAAGSTGTIPGDQATPADAELPASPEPGAATVPSPQRTSRTMSILALSLGIASFLFAQSVVVPLAAVILGVFGLRDEPSGRGFSIWGIVLACVATFGWVVILAAGALISLPFLFLAAF